MLRSRICAANRRRFLIGTASMASSFGFCPFIVRVAAQDPAGDGPRYRRELQMLEENARRAGVRAAAESRMGPPSVQDQTAYSELMPRLVDLIERSSAASPAGSDIAEAASELLSRVHRAERGEPPSDDFFRRSPPEFEELKGDYRRQFETCTTLPHRQASVAANIGMAARFRPRYQQVADKLDIPWYFIAIIHALEASFNFNGHLHNGDYPLTRRTVNVPAGRPLVWAPPAEWEASAADALRMKGYDKQKDWSLEQMLYRWERWSQIGAPSTNPTMLSRCAPTRLLPNLE